MCVCAVVIYVGGLSRKEKTSISEWAAVLVLEGMELQGMAVLITQPYLEKRLSKVVCVVDISANLWQTRTHTQWLSGGSKTAYQLPLAF